MASEVARRKVVIPGGTGHLGRILCRYFHGAGDHVTVLGRSAPERARRDLAPGVNYARWNGRDPGAWCAAIDGADVVVNLAGRTVDCRYNKTNLQEMLSSRVDSARAVGAAIESAAAPPALWLQMSTATVYAHTHGPANDEASGVIGGREPGVPSYWGFSVHIAEEWERMQREAKTPATRKVALRTAMVMSAERGGPFATMRRLARCGLGGSIAGGKMFMSWIHERDFVRATEHVIQEASTEGPVNFAAPTPLPQKEFMGELRRALGVPLGLPAAAWMIGLGAILLRTDPELILKSRRVVSGRLRDSGFEFEFADWSSAVRDLTG